MAGDVLHLGVSAAVTFQRATPGGAGQRSRSRGTLPLQWAAGGAPPSVLVAVPSGEEVWLSLRSVEPVALQVLVDGRNALTGEPLAPELQWDPQDHLALPDQRFFDGPRAGPGSARRLNGPPEPDGAATTLQMVARRLRSGAFHRWWVRTGQDQQRNRFGNPPQVTGGAGLQPESEPEPESAPQEVMPSAFGADDWDPVPFATVEVRLVHPDGRPWNSRAGD